MHLKKLSDDFIKRLLQISAGSISSADFEIFLTLTENEMKQTWFTQSSEANLMRIISGMYDKTFFLTECIKYPHYVEILVKAASNSNYLSDILVLNPEYFYLVVEPERLGAELSRAELNNELKSRTALFASLDAKVHALNAIKRREILRIGLQDIFLKNELPDIARELSVLASSVTAALFSICYDFILRKYKIEEIKRSYCIVSLGKLGGKELNYSSDIDLIIFYDEDTVVGNWEPGAGDKRSEAESNRRVSSKYYSEILSETIQLFLEKCTSSEAGSLYRIDLRLRPDGKSSPVCRSIREYLDYYETRGLDWERQMLIKADYLAGDINLYKHFIDYLDSFIYPATIFTSPIEQMRKLKRISEEEIGDAENIKIIPGGIRDIEFIVQALQLLNAGRNTALKTGNTLTAISKLQGSKLLSLDEAELLQSAYIFYRKIEHFLQLMNNKQTHIIPESGETAEKLSYFLKFRKLSDFRKKVEEYRKQVREIYDSILETPDIKKTERTGLFEIKFQHPQRALKDFNFLKEGKGLTTSRRFDRRSLESFGMIEQHLIEYLQKSKNPDLTLSNIVRVIKNADFPSIWYHEFVDKDFFTAFLNLCAFSQKSIELFAEDKVLREVFLSREIVKEIDFRQMLNYSIKKVLFVLSSKTALKLIPAQETSLLLSNFVREKIKQTASEHLKDKKWKDDWFIAVMGSTGTSTMSFASDIDLIFAARNIQKHRKLEQSFQDLLKLLRDSLSPFPVDCRLRPEGDSSQLVWEVEGYKNYFQSRARIWELQSFLKVNLICGNKKLFNSLYSAYLKRINRLSKDEILKGINEIRSKALSAFPAEVKLIDIKKNSGGLNDIEYIAHYLLLSNPEALKYYFGKPVPAVLKDLSKAKKKSKLLNSVADNYIFLKQLDMFNQIAENSRSSKISQEAERLDKLAVMLNYKSGELLLKKIRAVLKESRDAYYSIVN